MTETKTPNPTAAGLSDKLLTTIWMVAAGAALLLGLSFYVTGSDYPDPETGRTTNVALAHLSSVYVKAWQVYLSVLLVAIAMAAAGYQRWRRKQAAPKA